VLGLELAIRIEQVGPRVFRGDERQRPQRAARAPMLGRNPADCRGRRQRVGKLNAGAGLHFGPELRMNRASLLTPKHTAASVTTHHQDRCVLAFVAIDRVGRDHREHLAVFVGQRTNGVNVTATKPIADAIKARAGPHQQRLPFRENRHGLAKRGSEER